MGGTARAFAKRLGLKRPYRALRAEVVSRRGPERVWNDELPSELEFWARELPHRVATWPDYIRRADPRAPVRDPLMKVLIAGVPRETVSIIDVGAGPLTSLGKTYPGKALKITATDPLGREYARLMEEAGIEPPVRPIACRGEDLLERFAPSSFDIAFARNALDHSVDPRRVIANMVRLVRGDGFVLLKHRRNEGQAHAYRGLHQWNFDIEDGQLVISRPGRGKVELQRSFKATAAVLSFEVGGWLLCLLAKRGGSVAPL